MKLWNLALKSQLYRRVPDKSNPEWLGCEDIGNGVVLASDVHSIKQRLCMLADEWRGKAATNADVGAFATNITLENCAKELDAALATMIPLKNL